MKYTTRTVSTGRGNPLPVRVLGAGSAAVGWAARVQGVGGGVGAWLRAGASLCVGRAVSGRGDLPARMERALTGLDRQVREPLLRWRPQGWSRADLAVLDVVLGDVQGWVAVAGPQNAGRACEWLRIVSALTVFVYRSLGERSVEVVFDPGNVEVWSMIENAHRSTPWKQSARSGARRVGRAVYPAGWPPEPIRSPHRLPAAPYTSAQERLFLREAGLGGRANILARLWVVCAAFGLGLNGLETVWAGPGDVVDLGGGRLALEVSGRSARLVPVRGAYTATVLEAQERAGGQRRFLASTGKNAAHNVAGKLAVDGLGGLSFARGRSTWLVAHLAAGTPLPALRAIAGPLGAQTLDSLVEAMAAPLSPEDAARQGLGA